MRGDTLPREAVTSLVFLGQHDRQYPICHGGAGGVRAQLCAKLVEIIPFPENLAPLVVERSKVMFAVRVVFWRKGIKLAYQIQNLELLKALEGQDTLGKNHPASLKALSR